MKKIFFSIILIVVLILAVITVAISDKNIKSRNLAKFNSEYEQYLGKEIYGAELLGIINKALDNNEKNKVKQDENGYYLENSPNCIKVEITLLTTDDDGKTIEVVHQMERLNQIGLDRFISSFNLTRFECTNIDYTEEGRVNKVYIKQLEL